MVAIRLDGSVVWLQRLLARFIRLSACAASEEEMARAHDVAQYLLHLAATSDEPELLSHLRLQKLLYYAQGWSLGLTGRPLFNERIEAWAHGPVVKEVYRAFRDSGSGGIEPSNGFGEGLTTEEQDHILSVWEAYKQHSAWSLRNKTHGEAPWVDARRGFGPAEACEVEITHDALRKFFAAQADES